MTESMNQLPDLNKHLGLYSIPALAKLILGLLIYQFMRFAVLINTILGNL